MKTIVLSAGAVKRLHVKQLNIRSNLKKGTNLPVFLVQTSKGSYLARRIKIHHSAELIYGGPLSCGARAWVFTKGKLTLYV